MTQAGLADSSEVPSLRSGLFLLYFIINTKNYVETSGSECTRIAEIAKSVESAKIDSERAVSDEISLIISLPAFAVWKASTEFPDRQIFAQHLDDLTIGSTTGFLVPEIAKSFGARGSLVNHSEHRITFEKVEAIVRKLRTLNMTSVVCAGDAEEVFSFSKLDPDFVAIEPPELIGSGRAVSKARPDLILDSKIALQKVAAERHVRTKLLCGAGIVDPLDATMAVEMGAEGILVASGVVKSKDWYSSISGLALGLIAGLKERK